MCEQTEYLLVGLCPKSLVHEDLEISEIEYFSNTYNIDYCISFLVEVKILKALFPQLEAGDSVISMSPSFTRRLTEAQPGGKTSFQTSF